MTKHKSFSKAVGGKKHYITRDLCFNGSFLGGLTQLAAKAFVGKCLT